LWIRNSLAASNIQPAAESLRLCRDRISVYPFVRFISIRIPSAPHPHTIGHQRRATHHDPFPFSVCEVFDVRRRFVSTIRVADFVSRSSRGVLIMQRPVLMARSIWGAAFSISSDRLKRFGAYTTRAFCAGYFVLGLPFVEII
jgi:hypothetical protein